MSKVNKAAVCVKPFRGAPHGHTTFAYNPGDPVPAELADEQVSLGNAEFVEAEEVKAKAAAPENKGAVSEGEGESTGKKKFGRK